MNAVRPPAMTQRYLAISWDLWPWSTAAILTAEVDLEAHGREPEISLVLSHSDQAPIVSQVERLRVLVLDLLGISPRIEGKREAKRPREGQVNARRLPSLVVRGEAALDQADRNPEEDRRPEIDQTLEGARQEGEIRHMHGAVARGIDDHRERPRHGAHARVETDAVGSDAEDGACLRVGIGEKRLTGTERRADLSEP